MQPDVIVPHSPTDPGPSQWQSPTQPSNVLTTPSTGWWYHSQFVQPGPGVVLVVVLQSQVVVPSAVVVVVQSTAGVISPDAQLVKVH